jgi:hypothetical protein
MSKTPMTLQSLLFPKSEYTAKQAQAWAKKHDFHYGKVHTTDDFHRLRQKDPVKFIKGSFRTVKFDGSIRAIMGQLRPK